MEQVQIRTDLALEARESVSEKEEHPSLGFSTIFF